MSEISPDSVTWIEEVARLVAPDEESFAGGWLADFAAGGDRRKNLSPVDSIAGGAAAEYLVVTIPAVLWGLSQIAPQLQSLPTSSDVCKLASNCLEWMSLKAKSDSKAAPPEMPAEMAQSGHVVTVMRIVTQFETELRKRGVAKSSVSDVCLTVMKQVFQDPQRSQLVMAEISKAKK